MLRRFYFWYEIKFFYFIILERLEGALIVSLCFCSSFWLMKHAAVLLCLKDVYHYNIFELWWPLHVLKFSRIFLLLPGSYQDASKRLQLFRVDRRFIFVLLADPCIPLAWVFIVKANDEVFIEGFRCGYTLSPHQVWAW